MMEDNGNLPLDVANEDAEAARRDALTRLGVMGEYVAPAMMVLMNSKASAATITSGSTL